MFKSIAFSDLEALCELSELSWCCDGWRRPHWSGVWGYSAHLDDACLRPALLASFGSLFEMQNLGLGSQTY